MSFPKPKHKKVKYSKKEADTLFSLIIRSRGVCQAKGLDQIQCAGYHQCCHIVGRGCYNLRYDEKNALCMCAGHHIFYTNHPWEWSHDFIPKFFSDQYHYVNKFRFIYKKNIYKELIPLLKDRLLSLQGQQKLI